MKNYINIFLLFLCLGSSFCGYTQVFQSNSTAIIDTIEGLSIYPNPVTNGKLYITTANNLAKEIEIFDVLGKKIHSSFLFGKELDISKLTPGVYILKIKENSISTTRKLVVR